MEVCSHNTPPVPGLTLTYLVGILTDRSLTRHSEPEAKKQFTENADIRLDAESIARVSGRRDWPQNGS